MFDGFDRFDIDAGQTLIHGVRAGDGERPVLLLHGFPQNHSMWHSIAAALVDDGRTVVATDLRGYGDSGRPPAGDDHSGYSFRAMANDQMAVMSQLGFERFDLVGHDRGARVAHRAAIDHPDRLGRLALMDILPTAYVYDHVDRFLATAHFHWFFFIQPFDLPERLISGDPDYFIQRLLGAWGSGAAAHHPEALASYRRCFADPETRHAMLEDYRAGASIDLKHDRASQAAGERIRATTLVMWGADGVVGHNSEDPLTVWRKLSSAPGEMQGIAIPGAGHFLAEDQPEATLAALRGFLAAG
jgi:haloacetate dehalogenase